MLFENYDTHQMREPWGYSDGLVHYALLCAQRQVFAEVVIISFTFSLLDGTFTKLETEEGNLTRVTDILNELEKQGLIIRDLANATAYRALIRLTDAGSAAATFVCGKITQAVEIAGKGLTDQERLTFYNVLHRIAANLQSIVNSGLPEQPPVHQA